jgi:hypothetical protein
MLQRLVVAPSLRLRVEALHPPETAESLPDVWSSTHHGMKDEARCGVENKKKTFTSVFLQSQVLSAAQETSPMCHAIYIYHWTGSMM